VTLHEIEFKYLIIWVHGFDANLIRRSTPKANLVDSFHHQIKTK